jgi:ABC-2 type transport system permease protein
VNYGEKEMDPSTAPSASPLDIASGSSTHPLYWSARRELWENRFVYIAPLIVTAFVLLGSFISIARLPHRLHTVALNDPAKLHNVIVAPFSIAPAPIMLATFIIGVFYSLDALYGERRDRSILFWKSLPVSDLTAVLAKASIPLVVLPLIALVLSLATVAILLILGTMVLAGSRTNPAMLWSEFRFFQEPLIMIYGLAVHSLWFAPIHGWLLLVSAWSKRAPVIWALLPLLVLSAVERLAFGTSSFMYMLQYRLMGAMREAFAYKMKRGGHASFDQLTQLDPLRFFTRPGLWVGLAFAAICIAAAVRLRRYREPI